MLELRLILLLIGMCVHIHRIKIFCGDFVFGVVLKSKFTFWRHSIMIVFTPTHLRARKFSEEGAQEKSVVLLREAYESIYKLNIGLSAAVVIGSTVRGDATIASDIDVLAFWEDGSPWFWDGIAKTYRYLAPALTIIWEEFNVRVEANPVLKSQVLDKNNLRYDKQYLRHAVAAALSGGLLAGRADEVEHFHALAAPLTRETTLSYIDRKVHKVNQAQTCWTGLNEDKVARMYDNIVNSPFHALRRVFTLCGVSYVDSRSGLINSLRETGDELAEMRMRFLQDLGRQHVEYLERKRDKLPAGANPFERYGLIRITGEFRGAMEEMRKFAVAASPV